MIGMVSSLFLGLIKGFCFCHTPNSQIVLHGKLGHLFGQYLRIYSIFSDGRT